MHTQTDSETFRLLRKHTQEESFCWEQSSHTYLQSATSAGCVLHWSWTKPSQPVL